MKKEINYLETISSIEGTRKYFEKQLEKKLNLIKVKSPLFVKSDSGLQDNLTGIEKSISFVKDNEKYEIVHSLAKWKRDALGRYKFPVHTGLYTNMKAIRKDEIIDNIHSLFVEQWDWEKVINKSDRNIHYLKETVNKIYESLRKTAKYVEKKYNIKTKLPAKMFFITSQELEDMYPNNTPKEREELIVKNKKAVFIIGIGDKLKSGIEHDLRSPDYDDWSLDGDLLVYDEVIDRALELSSMGIRVDEKSIIDQLKKANALDRINLPYHQNIINKEIPYTIGGGIGESRVLMFLLKKSHIAFVQSSSWDKNTLKLLKSENVL